MTYSSSENKVSVEMGGKTKSRVLCVIVNYLDEQSTVAAIESIRAMGLDADHQIVVVDNNSTKLHNSLFKDAGADHVITSKLNLGFGGGVNLAIKELSSCDFEYLWLFNNDAIAQRESLTKLLEVADQTEADIVGSTIYYLDQPNRYWCKYSTVYRPWFIVRNLGKKRVETSTLTGSRVVNFINGCSTLIRRQLFEQLDGFDEPLFLYCEDLDLCIRSQEAGGKLVAALESKVLHAVSGSTGGEFNFLREYYITRNSYVMINRYCSNSLVRWFASISRLPWDCYRFTRTAISSGKWGKSVKLLLRAIADGRSNRLGMLDID